MLTFTSPYILYICIVYIYTHYVTRPGRVRTFTVLQSYVQEVSRAAPGWGCIRPIEAWTELRTRTDRRTNWRALARAVVAAWGRRQRRSPLPSKGPVLRGTRRTAATHGRSEHVPNIYTFYVTYI